jgi:hypothetical protein
MATWRCDVKTTIQAANVRNRPAQVGGRAMGETLRQDCEDMSSERAAQVLVVT